MLGTYCLGSKDVRFVTRDKIPKRKVLQTNFVKLYKFTKVIVSNNLRRRLSSLSLAKPIFRSIRPSWSALWVLLLFLNSFYCLYCCFTYCTLLILCLSSCRLHPPEKNKTSVLLVFKNYVDSENTGF